LKRAERFHGHEETFAAQTGRRRPKWVTWIVAAGVAGLVVYGLSQVSGVAYNEEAIRVSISRR